MARAIADHFRRDIHPEALADYPNVDGVVALTHGAGCATDSDGEDAAGAAPHARRLCQACQLRRGAGGRPGLRDQPDQAADGAGRPAPRAHAASLQHPGHRRHRARPWRAASSSIKGMLEAGQPGASAQPVPASHITVGLQCGGSDGYSGISANPALGAAVDRLVRHGGTRDPLGDARDLRRRAPADAPRGEPRGGREAGRAHPLVGGLHRAQRHGDGQQPVGRQQGRRPDDHPREVARARSPRAAPPTWSTWCEYAEPVTAKGLVFMDTPGYDPVSATGQVAGGANLICFTTGRGSAYGCAPSPVAQAGDQHRAVAQAGGRHRHQLRRHHRRQRRPSTRWASASSG